MAATSSSRAPQIVRVKRHRDEPPIESLILGGVDGDSIDDRSVKRQTPSRPASSEPLSEVDRLAFLFEQAKIVEQAMLQAQKAPRPTLFKRVTTRAVATPEERREQLYKKRNPFDRASTKQQASRGSRHNAFVQQRSIPSVRAVRGAATTSEQPAENTAAAETPTSKLTTDVLIDSNWLRQKSSRSKIPIVCPSFKGASPDDFVVDVLERQEAEPSPEEIEECAWRIPKFDLVFEEEGAGDDGDDDPDDPDLDGREIDYPSDNEVWPEEEEQDGSDDGERWCTRPKDPDTNEYSFHSHDSFSDAGEFSNDDDGDDDPSFNDDGYHENSDDREAWENCPTSLAWQS